MFSTITTTDDRKEPGHNALEREELHPVEGTMKRVDYRKKFSVVAGQQVCHFALDSESRLWFDGQPAVLGCFHPLDHVKILFQEQASVSAIKAMYAWEKEFI